MHTAAVRAPRTVSPTVLREPESGTPAQLPASEQIAAEMRRRPIGGVATDICRDLGILRATRCGASCR